MNYPAPWAGAFARVPTMKRLVGYVYNRDVGPAFRFAERLEAGMVGLNTRLASNPAAPFGGVKQSGLGREGGKERIEEWLGTRYAGALLEMRLRSKRKRRARYRYGVYNHPNQRRLSHS